MAAMPGGIFMAANKIDMTTGPIMQKVFLFALPICFGNILQMLYNTVDTIVIGNFCGSVSLAAVGTGSQPVEMLLAVFMGIGNGVSILVSQYVGSGNEERLRCTIETATGFLFYTAVPLSVLGLFIGPLLLKAMNVPDDTWSLSAAYIDILFLGTLGNMGYNLNAGILRGLGDSSSSLMFLLSSCIINIILDIVFVAGLGMDVPGAAAATVIAMFASWGLSIYYIRKKYPSLAFGILPKKMDKAILKQIIAIGLPLGLNNSIYSVGHILMQGLINMEGAVFMAGCAAAGKISGIANVTVTSLSGAATTFAGQNLGAADYKRLKSGGIRIPLISGIITGITGLIFTFVLCDPILLLFTRDAEVLEAGRLFLRCVLPFYWMYAVFNGIICFVNGLGEVKYPTIVNILLLWAVRIPVGYLIHWFIDGRYVNASISVSFAFGMVCMLAFFFTKRWKNICKKAAQSAIIDEVG